MFAHERHDHHCNGCGRGGNHARAAADQGNDDGNRNRSIETDAGIHAGHDRKTDSLGDQRQSHHDAGKDVGPHTRTVGKPLATVALKSVCHQNSTKARRAQMRVKRRWSCMMLSGGSAAGIATRNCTGSLRLSWPIVAIAGRFNPACRESARLAGHGRPSSRSECDGSGKHCLTYPVDACHAGSKALLPKHL